MQFFDAQGCDAAIQKMNGFSYRETPITVAKSMSASLVCCRFVCIRVA